MENTINHKDHEGFHKEHKGLIFLKYSLWSLWFLCALCVKKKHTNLKQENSTKTKKKTIDYGLWTMDFKHL
jgi:hypothetical protein